MISHNSTGWLRLSWLVPLLSLWDFSCTCCQMGLDPRCYSMRLLFPCGNLSSGSSPHGLSLPWTFYMVSLDLQEVELEVFRCPQCLEFASLRIASSTFQWSKQSQSQVRFKGEGHKFHLLKGKAEMFGVIFHIPNPQRQGSSPAASWWWGNVQVTVLENPLTTSRSAAQQDPLSMQLFGVKSFTFDFS